MLARVLDHAVTVGELLIAAAAIGTPVALVIIGLVVLSKADFSK